MENSTSTPTLFSKKISAKGKTYYTTVKVAKNGNKYMTITESGLQDGNATRRWVMVFEENMDEFVKTIHEAAQFVLNKN